MKSFSNNAFFSLFKKKKPIVFPEKFAIIKYSDSAKLAGTLDETNKIIEIYKDGRFSPPAMQYNEENVKAIEEIDKIPVIEEKFEEEDFKFEEVANFGSVEYRI